MSPALAQVRQLHHQLQHWLLDAAFPLWWEVGADHIAGGFHEALGQGGMPIAGMGRRARVQPRQIYCYAQARRLGWSRPAEPAIEHGLNYFLDRYSRSDGTFRTLVAANGETLDDSVVLYDQAFALLGLAAAFQALDRHHGLEQRATELRAVLLKSRKHATAGFSEFGPDRLLLANPHMHLLEACLEWHEVGGDDGWLKLAEEIRDLALDHLIDPDTGAIGEYFDEHWRPASGLQGQIVEPGHQYEWAWLLMRCTGGQGASTVPQVAERMISFADRYGVDKATGLACNALIGKSVHDGGARLWPQTERIKAHARRAASTGDDRGWEEAVRSCAVLLDYLDTPVRGLWRDRVDKDRRFVEEPAPASSFYHIVCALSELGALIGESDASANGYHQHQQANSD